MRRALDEVHRTYRRDLVLYRPPQPRRSERDGHAPPDMSGGSRCEVRYASRQERRDMDFNKLTIKSQEAIAAAQDAARRRGNPELTPEHLLLALLDQELFSGWQALRADAERKVAALPSVQGGQQQPNACRVVLARARARRQGARADGRRLRLDRAPLPRARAGAARRDRGVDRVDPRRAARHVAGPRGHLPGALEVRPRPDRGRRGGQARPGDRPRRGDPSRDPDPLAPHEEQPGADRRARRRQDRDRRRARAADRRRRRPRGAQGPARSGRSTSARCSRARSTAASSRSG